jgi:adenine deaminase
MKIEGNVVDIHEKTIFGGQIVIEKGIIKSIIKTGCVYNSYIMPGFIDAHVHVESSMVTPSEFARAAVMQGTVAIVSDPHEIANVLGVNGVNFMISDAKYVPVKFLFGAPSCVPATSFETSGAVIDATEIEKMLDNPDIGYLGEMMNFPGVIYDEQEVMKKLHAAKKAGKKIDGHAPGLSGENLRKYINAGISTDHECSTLGEAKEKISLGMKILIREGSAARNLDALKPLIDEYPDMVMLCSDDLHPEMLEKGHINVLVARLINQGCNMFNVIRAATMNPVQHYSLGTGLLRVGDNADFIVVDDFKTMHVTQTWIDGNCVYLNGNVEFADVKPRYENRFNASSIMASGLRVKNIGKSIKIIKAFNGELYTASEDYFPGPGEFIESNTEKDILKIVVKERYKDSPPAIAFIKGFGLKNGAFATSVAHDSHNIIAIGTTDQFLANAINGVISSKGGMTVASENDNMILALPVAGIMSERPVKEVADSYKKLSEAVKKMGCTMDAPFMTLSFMALLVIPEIKLSDKGLFDGKKFCLTSLYND